MVIYILLLLILTAVGKHTNNLKLFLKLKQNFTEDCNNLFRLITSNQFIGKLILCLNGYQYYEKVYGSLGCQTSISLSSMENIIY